MVLIDERKQQRLKLTEFVQYNIYLCREHQIDIMTEASQSNESMVELTSEDNLQV